MGKQWNKYKHMSHCLFIGFNKRNPSGKKAVKKLGNFKIALAEGPLEAPCLISF